MAIRCDHCRESLGLIVHRYWRMRFCSRRCADAYRHRLDEDTMTKIQALNIGARDKTTEQHKRRLREAA
jgi:hypothetical protein